MIYLTYTPYFQLIDFDFDLKMSKGIAESIFKLYVK